MRMQATVCFRWSESALRGWAALALGAMVFMPSLLQAQAPSRPPPRTIAQLAEGGPPSADGALQRVRDLPETASYTAYLVAYQSSGWRVHALVAQPKGPVPGGGFPVLVANHG